MVTQVMCCALMHFSTRVWLHSLNGDVGSIGNRNRLPERTLEDATAVTSYRLLSATLRSLGLPSSPEQHYDAYRMDRCAANDAGGGSTLATDTLFRELHASPAEYRRTLLDAGDPYAAERGP